MINVNYRAYRKVFLKRLVEREERRDQRGSKKPPKQNSTNTLQYIGLGKPGKRVQNVSLEEVTTIMVSLLFKNKKSSFSRKGVSRYYHMDVDPHVLEP